MPSMVGSQPIDHYYPDGFGELNVVDQDDSSSTTTTEIVWFSPSVLNRRYNETSPETPIYEARRFLAEGEDQVCGLVVFLRAGYQSLRGQPPTTGGPVKYAIVEGVFPPSMTLDIDTGRIYGKVDDLDVLYPEYFNVTVPKTYTEDNYAREGSAALYNGGFGLTKDVVFIARAFDSDAPSTRYIDGVFVIRTRNNWSSDRDEFILNIDNQFFVDGRPVSNEEYLSAMKARGYFPDECP